jgi:CheY-like chemotaxis protein
MGELAPHILIVDDDPAVVEALTAALKATYVVHGAATGKWAYGISPSKFRAGDRSQDAQAREVPGATGPWWQGVQRFWQKQSRLSS